MRYVSLLIALVVGAYAATAIYNGMTSIASSVDAANQAVMHAVQVRK